jgi:hypothetical protein
MLREYKGFDESGSGGYFEQERATSIQVVREHHPNRRYL